MDAAGVAKSALVQASTCYGHDNSYVADAVAAYPNRFTGRVLGGCAGPGRARANAPLAQPQSHRHAALHHRQHHGDPGRLDRRSARLSGLAGRRRARSVDLHADVASALPQLVAMVKRFPEVKVLLDHLARPVLSDGPPYAAAAPCSACPLSHRLSQGDAADIRRMPQRQGDAGDFFEKLVAEFGASRIAWGSNYPSSEGTLPPCSRSRATR